MKFRYVYISGVLLLPKRPFQKQVVASWEPRNRHCEYKTEISFIRTTLEWPISHFRLSYNTIWDICLIFIKKTRCGDLFVTNVWLLCFVDVKINKINMKWNTKCLHFWDSMSLVWDCITRMCYLIVCSQA